MKQIVWPGWQTVKVIGSGSYGKVYEIERQVFGRTEKAALKVITLPRDPNDIEELYSEGYDNESITQRFKSYLEDIVAEYSLMAEMKGHTNVVYCDDLHYIQHEDGLGWDIYIKMELLTPLMKTLQKGIPPQTVIKVGKDICRALILCKSRNIVHRDIKPQNIFVSKDGDYKLGDFGIAKTAEKTTGGTKIGTYKYMAPEVYNNQPYGSAADIYSLGMVLYWMLNDRRTPFLCLPPEIPTASEEENARYRRFSGEQIPAPAHGSAELQKVVLRAVAYHPTDRYTSAEEMLQDLQALDIETVPMKECEPSAQIVTTDENTILIEESEEATAISDMTDSVSVEEAGFVKNDSDEKTEILPEAEIGNITLPDREYPELTSSIQSDNIRVATPNQWNHNRANAEEGTEAQSISANGTLNVAKKKGRIGVWLFAMAIVLALSVAAAIILPRILRAQDSESLTTNRTDEVTLQTQETLPEMSGTTDANYLKYQTAMEALDSGDYVAAKSAFSELGDYADASTMVLECDYQEATALLKSGEYTTSKTMFAELGEYSDSATMVLECEYQMGISLLESGAVVDAKTVFESIADYSSADNYINKCDYLIAQEALENGEYETAKSIFAEIDDYKDAKFMVEIICDHAYALDLFEQLDGATLADVLLEFSQKFIIDGQWNTAHLEYGGPNEGDVVDQAETVIGTSYYTDNFDFSNYNQGSYWLFITKTGIDLWYADHQISYWFDNGDLGIMITSMESPESEMRYAAWFNKTTGKLSSWSFWTVEPYNIIKNYG